MEHCNRKAFLVPLVAVIALSAGVVRAQDQKPTKDELARVSLGTTSGNAGDLMVVPVYFSPAVGVTVGRLGIEIGYVSANLKFSGLEPGIAANADGVQLQFAVKEGKNEKEVDTQTLRITASTSAAEASEKGLPEGLLAFVMLKISEDGRSARITLHGSAEAGELGSKPLQKLSDFETTVDIFGAGAQPMLTCFFFTH